MPFARSMQLHAAEERPREACGLVMRAGSARVYVPCRNIAPGAEHFEAAPEDIVAAEARGPILAVFHSHPDASSEPSDADRAMADEWGVPWLILGSDGLREHRPAGYHAPLLGRVFEHGRLDCFALIRDYFLELLGIQLPDFAREDDWWARGGNLYLEGYERAGFVDVTGQPMQPHDVPLMQLAAPVPNHAGVLLPDGQLLHHAPKRLSRRESYSGFWANLTRRVVRHRELC